MRTDVADTSLEAYDALKTSPILGKKQKQILDAMQTKRAYTRRELSRLCNMETSSVAGRVNELIFMRYVEVVGRKECPITHKLVEAVQKVADYD